jgi:cytochrome c oxidase subunit 2
MRDAEKERRVGRRVGTRWAVAGATAPLLLATACGRAPEAFDPVTDRGHEIRGLFVLVLLLSACVFLLVAGLIAVMVVRFRARPGAPEPPQTEGNRAIEVAWTAAPAVLLAVVFVFTVRTMRAVDGGAADPLVVQVIGHQWWWEYRYPAQGIVTANELRLPVDRPVRLEITGADVIHSFWSPQLGWKLDAIPGKTNVMTFVVTEAGVYDGACAEFCGAQHAWMRIRVVAEPGEQFDQWVRDQQRPAAAPATEAARRGQQLFLGNTCVNCHTIEGTAAQGTVGPNLTHFGSRGTIGAGVLVNTPENLKRWIHDPQAIKPNVLMPAFRLSEEELQALVNYLEGLK